MSGRIEIGDKTSARVNQGKNPDSHLTFKKIMQQKIARNKLKKANLLNKFMNLESCY